MTSYLDFEKPVADLAAQIRELKKLSQTGDSVNVESEIARLEAKRDEALGDIYGKLSPWQRTQVARHPDRPHFVDYRDALFTEWTELAGDRQFAEDAAILAGLARFDGEPVALIGQEKGHDTASRVKHNFGSARPEGYRKAARLMEMADRFAIPIVTLVDTAGAYPGVGAEERGQAEAIARATQAGRAISANRSKRAGHLSRHRDRRGHEESTRPSSSHPAEPSGVAGGQRLSR